MRPGLMGRSLPSPIRLSSPKVFRIGGLSLVRGGPFAAFRASIGAGRVGADHCREVDHPPGDALPEWPPPRPEPGPRRTRRVPRTRRRRDTAIGIVGRATPSCTGPPLNTHCTVLRVDGAVLMVPPCACEWRHTTHLGPRSLRRRRSQSVSARWHSWDGPRLPAALTRAELHLRQAPAEYLIRVSLR
jgi:hypothetical protein